MKVLYVLESYHKFRDLLQVDGKLPKFQTLKYFENILLICIYFNDISLCHTIKHTNHIKSKSWSR